MLMEWLLQVTSAEGGASKKEKEKVTCADGVADSLTKATKRLAFVLHLEQMSGTATAAARVKKGLWRRAGGAGASQAAGGKDTLMSPQQETRAWRKVDSHVTA